MYGVDFLQFKAKGNEFLQGKKFDEAIAAYSKVYLMERRFHIVTYIRQLNWIVLTMYFSPIALLPI